MLLGKIKSLFQPKRKTKLSRDDIQAIFRTKYVNFKILLDSNSELLKIISEIEEKLRGETIFGMSFIRSQTLRALFHAGRMIRSFESLSGRPSPMLSAILDQIHQIIQQEQEIQPAPRIPELKNPWARRFPQARNLAHPPRGKRPCPSASWRW